jgi:DnaJ-like protein
MLSKRTLEELNSRPRGRRWSPFVALGAGVAALAVALLFSYALAFAVFAAGAAGYGLLHRREAQRRTVRLSYGLLDPETEARFANVRKACEILAASEKIWRIQKDEVPVPKHKTSDEEVEVRIFDLPGISADVDVWGIAAGDSRVFFLPECVLTYEGDLYRAISYRSFSATIGSERTVEEGEVPDDAEVVGHTWRYVREDGSPDGRFGANPRLPEVLYGVLELSSETWPGLSLRVSNESAAAQFALAFVAGREDPDRYERWHGVRPYEEREDPTHQVLGVRSDASKAEITAAYRQMVRTYHPDKTIHFLPEFQELAQQRIREINAAYARLKRQAT